MYIMPVVKIIPELVPANMHLKSINLNIKQFVFYLRVSMKKMKITIQIRWKMKNTAEKNFTIM